MVVWAGLQRVWGSAVCLCVLMGQVIWTQDWSPYESLLLAPCSIYHQHAIAVLISSTAATALQAAGYATSFTPTKLVQAGGGESGTWTGGMQDALLTAVLKCAKAKPKEAATFLGYATAVVGIAPSGIDLAKVTELWDAAVAAGREGRAAVLAVVMDALGSPPPPSTQARGAGRVSEVTRAAQEEDGWNAFVSTAAWWLGENANALCDEFCGRKLTPTAIPASIQAAAAAAAASAAAAAAAAAGTQRAAAGSGSDEEGLAAALPAADESGDDAESGDGDGDAAAAAAAAATSAAELLQQFGGRSPTLSRIMLALQSLMLTAVWQLRLAAAQVCTTTRSTCSLMCLLAMRSKRSCCCLRVLRHSVPALLFH
jgi:hypothetical protein